MLSFFRGLSKSKVVWVILGLPLVAGLLIFGNVRDVFGNVTGRDAVVAAGKRTVTSPEFKKVFDDAKKDAEQRAQRPITTEEAVSQGAIDSLLQSLASREGLMAALSKAGIQPSDALLVQQIRKIPAFFNQVTGQFDQSAYQQRLAAGGLTPAQFEKGAKDELAFDHFRLGLAGGLQAPMAFSALAASSELEQRTFSAFFINPASVPPPATPTDAQLQAFIKAHTAQLTLPERRNLTVVRFSAKALEPSMTADETEVRKRYDFRKDTLSTPEKRTVIQVPAKDAAGAAAVAARLAKGEDPAAVAKSTGVEPIRYADVPQTAISDTKIAQAAFATASGAVSAPVQGGLGWAVLKVASVTPGKAVSFEQARAGLEAEVRTAEAQERIYDVVQKYDDAHSGGASLKEAAKAAGVTALDLPPVTAQGIDQKGQPSPILSEKLLKQAFDLPEGGESDVVDDGKGEYFAVRVEKIIPAAVPPLDQARPQFTALYMREKMGEALKARLDDLSARIRKGESMDAVAASIGSKLDRMTLDVRTAGQDQSQRRQVFAAVFSAKPGEIIPLGTGLVRVETVRPGNLQQAAAMTRQGEQSLRVSMFQDMSEQAAAWSRINMKVKVDPKRARTALGLAPEPDAPVKGETQVSTAPADFAAAYDAGRPQVVFRRVVDDLETPVSAYLKIGHGSPYAFLFESVEGGESRGRYSIVSLKPDLVWRCRGDRAEISEGADLAAGRFQPQPGGALDSLRDLVARSRIDLPPELPPMAAGVFGAIGYDMVRLAEHLPDTPPDTLGLPDGVMTRPSVVAVFDSIGQEIVLVATARPDGSSADQAYAAAQARLDAVAADLRRALPPTSDRSPVPAAPLHSPVSRADYAIKVETAKAYIRAGDIFQVVPSHRFEAPFALEPFAFYRSLRRTNPSPYMYFMDFGDFHIAGSSPEILVRLRDGKITIRPIAGTRPRGKSLAEDLAMEQELLADPKERSEHLMLLDLGRNDVGRVAMLKEEGSNHPPTVNRAPHVRVTESFVIERYSHVMHIVSNVVGDAPEGLDPVDVLMAALPAGTLSGAPKVRAMQIIDELEGVKRGIGYGGACGYISSEGQVDTAIILRTALFKDGMIYCQAGGGVVADSDPDAEYEETIHKSNAVRRAAEEAWRFA